MLIAINPPIRSKLSNFEPIRKRDHSIIVKTFLTGFIQTCVSSATSNFPFHQPKTPGWSYGHKFGSTRCFQIPASGPLIMGLPQSAKNVQYIVHNGVQNRVQNRVQVSVKTPTLDSW